MIFKKKKNHNYLNLSILLHLKQTKPVLKYLRHYKAGLVFKKKKNPSSENSTPGYIWTLKWTTTVGAKNMILSVLHKHINSISTLLHSENTDSYHKNIQTLLIYTCPC